jgi:hypothetical protein
MLHPSTTDTAFSAFDPYKFYRHLFPAGAAEQARYPEQTITQTNTLRFVA